MALTVEKTSLTETKKVQKQVPTSTEDESVSVSPETANKLLELFKNAHGGSEEFTAQFLADQKAYREARDVQKKELGSNKKNNKDDEEKQVEFGGDQYKLCLSFPFAVTVSEKHDGKDLEVTNTVVVTAKLLSVTDPQMGFYYFVNGDKYPRYFAYYLGKSGEGVEVVQLSGDYDPEPFEHLANTAGLTELL